MNSLTIKNMSALQPIIVCNDIVIVVVGLFGCQSRGVFFFFKQILLSVLKSNTVTIVGVGNAAVIPHNTSEINCDSLFGLKYCTKKLQADVHDKSDVPYFPLGGETR